MKIMNVLVLLFGLVGNIYLSYNYVDYGARLKLAHIWSLFTPEAKKAIRHFCSNAKDMNTTQKNDATQSAYFEHLAPVFNKVDSKLLYLFLDREEKSYLSQKKRTEIKQLESELDKLLNKGLTSEQCCNQLFGTIITKNGCVTLADNKQPSPSEMKDLIELLMMQKDLNERFD